MATITMLVEMLIAGAIADIWVFLIIAKIVNIDFASLTEILSSYTELLLLPFVAITYGLGIAINFLAEALTKNYWDEKIKKKLFDGLRKELGKNKKELPDKDISGRVFHKGRQEVIDGIRDTVHLIRVSRSTSLNFLLIAGSILLYWQDLTEIVLFVSLFSFSVSVLTYREGKNRFKQNHDRTISEYRELLEESEK